MTWSGHRSIAQLVRFDFYPTQGNGRVRVGPLVMSGEGRSLLVASRLSAREGMVGEELEA